MKKTRTILICIITLLFVVAFLAIIFYHIKDSNSMSQEQLYSATETGDLNLQPGDSDYNLIKSYAKYFNTKKVSLENVDLQLSDVSFCAFYSEREITASLLTSTTIEDIKEMYGLQYLRKTKDMINGADFVYSIHPIRDDNSFFYLVITYNINGYVIDSFCSDKILSTHDFLDLKEGESTYNDVYKIDNSIRIDGDLNFTHHKCYKGNEVVIKYQQLGEEYIVSNISYNADKVRITGNMLDEDLELFQQIN